MIGDVLLYKRHRKGKTFKEILQIFAGAGFYILYLKGKMQKGLSFI